MKYRLCLMLLGLSIFVSSPCYAAPIATPSDAKWEEESVNEEDLELINDLEPKQHDFDYTEFSENVDSIYTVVVPGHVQLGETSDGTWSAVYKVGAVTVDEDVGISVKPTSKVISLKSIGKKSISAHIEQDITEFNSDIQETQGCIWVDDYDLSAGKWSGVFSFHIKVNKIETISDLDVEIASPSNAVEKEGIK